jgi:hypothetical protein
MAGKVALMYRRHEAIERLTAALDALRDRLGIDELSIPLTGKDPDLLAVLQIEAMADVAEAVGQKLDTPTDETADASTDDAATEPAVAEGVADDTTDTADATDEPPAPAEQKAANATTKKAR